MKTSNNKKFSFKYIVWLVAVAFLIILVKLLINKEYKGLECKK